MNRGQNRIPVAPLSTPMGKLIVLPTPIQQKAERKARYGKRYRIPVIKPKELTTPTTVLFSILNSHGASRLSEMDRRVLIFIAMRNLSEECSRTRLANLFHVSKQKMGERINRFASCGLLVDIAGGGRGLALQPRVEFWDLGKCRTLRLMGHAGTTRRYPYKR